MSPNILILIPVVLSACSVLCAEDEIRSTPPGGDLRVSFSRVPTGDYSVSVSNRDGTKVFSEAVDLRVTPIIWNKKGTMGAFSAGDGFIMDGYVLFLQGPDSRLIKLPGPEHGWDNYHLTPIGWSDNVLHLSVDGPHAGKANGYHFSGKMKVALKAAGEAPKVIEEKIEVDRESEKD